MKYELKNFEFVAPGELKFKIEQVSVEYNVEELTQFAINSVNVIDAIKNAIKELAPVISMEIEKHQQIQHSHRLERMEKETALKM